MEIEQYISKVNEIKEKIENTSLYDESEDNDYGLYYGDNDDKHKIVDKSVDDKNENNEYEDVFDNEDRIVHFNYDEYSYDASELIEEYLDNTIELLNDINTYVNNGYYFRIPQSIQDVKYLLSNDDVLGFLAKNEIFTDDILYLLEKYQFIVDQNKFYEGNENKLPLNLIKDLKDELIYSIINNPELLFEINPRLFEELIAKIFTKFGMKVDLTQQTRDGGYDIVAFEDNKYSHNKYLIECKRYKPENKVGIQYIDRLIGAHWRNTATKSILVTSSSFTADAKKAAEQHKWTLELRDYDDILNWLNLFWKKL